MTAPVTIAQRLLRWTVEGVAHDVYVVRSTHRIVVPDIGHAFCDTHHSSDSECTSAISAALCQRIKDNYPDEGN